MKGEKNFVPEADTANDAIVISAPSDCDEVSRESGRLDAVSEEEPHSEERSHLGAKELVEFRSLFIIADIVIVFRDIKGRPLAYVFFMGYTSILST